MSEFALLINQSLKIETRIPLHMPMVCRNLRRMSPTPSTWTEIQENIVKAIRTLLLQSCWISRGYEQWVSMPTTALFFSVNVSLGRSRRKTKTRPHISPSFLSSRLRNGMSSSLPDSLHHQVWNLLDRSCNLQQPREVCDIPRRKEAHLRTVPLEMLMIQRLTYNTAGTLHSLNVSTWSDGILVLNTM